MPSVTDAIVAEIISRLPQERIATGAYTTAELTSWVKNLAENLVYLDGSRRGVELAWAYHNVTHNLDPTGQRPPKSPPPAGLDNQFRAPIAVVYRRHEVALRARGHALPDLVQQTTAISCRKRFKGYDGRAQLPKLIFFYAQEAVRELGQRRKADAPPVPPVRNQAADPYEELDRYVRNQAADPYEELDRYVRIRVSKSAL